MTTLTRIPALGPAWQGRRRLSIALVVVLAAELAVLAVLVARLIAGGPAGEPQSCRLLGPPTFVRDDVTYVIGADTHAGEVHEGRCVEVTR